MNKKEKDSICRVRHRAGMNCRDCVCYQTEWCKKTLKEKEKRNESTGKESY